MIASVDHRGSRALAGCLAAECVDAAVRAAFAVALHGRLITVQEMEVRRRSRSRDLDIGIARMLDFGIGVYPNVAFSLPA
ncbi:hypothetical protein [Bradyrhizobium sp.]|uniref:hypothetical protein n=1 Tax=Bradyrhizobium sp. TaxID=376 RepID=UPI0035201129